MPAPSVECALCGDPLNPLARTTVRLSNTQPPWGARSAIASFGRGLSEVMRVVSDIPEQTYWFHQSCWDQFATLLNGRN